MLCRSMNWFLYDWDFRDERGVNDIKVRWLERRQIKHKIFGKKYVIDLDVIMTNIFQ